MFYISVSSSLSTFILHASLYSTSVAAYKPELWTRLAGKTGHTLSNVVRTSPDVQTSCYNILNVNDKSWASAALPFFNISFYNLH